ncbi:hypothetical protein [Streptomyces sp. NPDC048002]|uniref:hypothetical protein n=1 Tax=Streptomyces sp. NPDC048002 TaxID=3154344 RepID=UPI0033EC9472
MAGQSVREAPARTFAVEGVVCPSVELPAIPAQAQEEVARNLELLDRQLAEANSRLVRSQGEGGPNFVQNAILGPLESKRTAALNRIETAVGRVVEKPEGLERFAPCELEDAVGGGVGSAAGEADGQEAGAAQEAGGTAEVGKASRITCPDVAGEIPADVPAGARGQAERELATLVRQIDEANSRLERSQGEGGPNFVENAILGPLASKRKAVIDRLEIAFEREGGVLPAGLDALAKCRLNG